VQGGLGDDQIDGMGGDDVLEGNDGKDSINGDGLVKIGLMNSVAGPSHGADFLDGGLGNDSLTGGGGNDVVYGGGDNDSMWGDASGRTSDAGYLDVAYHGADYMDGAIDLLAARARHSCAAGRFSYEVQSLEMGNQCVRRRLKHSNTKTAHAYSMRLAGHKELGRCMNCASSDYPVCVGAT
jgi:hypothetical protein